MLSSMLYIHSPASSGPSQLLGPPYSLELSGILHLNAESSTKFASNLTITCCRQRYLNIYPAPIQKTASHHRTARSCRPEDYNGHPERGEYCHARNITDPGYGRTFNKTAESTTPDPAALTGPGMTRRGDSLQRHSRGSGRRHRSRRRTRPARARVCPRA